MFRKILFWLHLSAGVVAGSVILIISVTGVLLAFQRQITDYADRRNISQVSPTPDASPLQVEEILRKVNFTGTVAPTAITIRNAPAEPYIVELGREKVMYVDPYSGAILGQGSQGVRKFFRAVTDWHRWLGAGPESRQVGRAITGACNLIFLGIVLSGPFLWLPRKWRWPNVRAILFFRGGLNGKARDFNWHNVIGIWCAIPLVVVVATAVAMSYPWANNALYRITGNQPPPVQQGLPEGGQRPGANERESGVRQAAARGLESTFDGLAIPLEQAKTQDPTWVQITMRLPSKENPSSVQFTIVNGIEGRPDHRSQLVLKRDSGEVIRWEPFAKNNAGRRLRIWFRFLHTGEAGGVTGQAIAALASAGAVLLMYTGTALAIQRLIAWNRRRKGSYSVQEPALSSK